MSRIPSTLALSALLGGALPLSSKAEEVPVRVGQPFPAIALPALEGGAPRSIEEFRGRKVLLHQFASW